MEINNTVNVRLYGQYEHPMSLIVLLLANIFAYQSVSSGTQKGLLPDSTVQRSTFLKVKINKYFSTCESPGECAGSGRRDDQRRGRTLRLHGHRVVAVVQLFQILWHWKTSAHSFHQGFNYLIKLHLADSYIGSTGKTQMPKQKLKFGKVNEKEFCRCCHETEASRVRQKWCKSVDVKCALAVSPFFAHFYFFRFQESEIQSSWTHFQRSNFQLLVVVTQRNGLLGLRAPLPVVPEFKCVNGVLLNLVVITRTKGKMK